MDIDVVTTITKSMIEKTEKVLCDNGIEKDEVHTVLQAIGYTLLDTELYPEKIKSSNSDNERLLCNRIILKKITEYTEKHPDLRFNQILSNLGVTWDDLFFEESSDTLSYMCGKKFRSNDG